MDISTLWALTLITASIWDGKPNGTHTVGFYKTEKQCETAASRLGLAGREQTKYTCAIYIQTESPTK